MNVSLRRPCLGRLALPTALVATCVALLAALAAAPAMAQFGLNEFDVTFTNKDGTPDTQAGSHPFEVTTSFKNNYTEAGPFEFSPDGEVRELIFDQIEGFVGDPQATPTCPFEDFLTLLSDGSQRPSCPNNTAVGVANTSVFYPFPYVFYASAVYNLPPTPGTPARLGFRVAGEPVVVDVGVNDAPPYDVKPVVRGVPQVFKFYGSRLTLWGNPSDPAHDPYRGHCLGGEMQFSTPPYGSEGNCPVENAPRSFITLPRSCTGPAATTYEADSWQEPGKWLRGSVLTHDDAEPPNPQGMTGCGKLPFKPGMSAKPSSASAESPTGLDFNLDFNQEGLTSEDGLAQSDVKKTVVTLPTGVTINPSVGEGLGYCSRADYEREGIALAAGEGCPSSSKIGSVEVETPLLPEAVKGSVYLAQQGDPATPDLENPFDSLIAFYIVLKDANQGIFVKMPAKVEPDPTTGQLVTTVDDIPQLPFSHFNLHFREGSRSPLTTPPACGTYDTVAELTPWSDPSAPVSVVSSFEVTGGIDQGACPPGGIPPFKPDFEAGSLNNNAASYSPFDMRLIRHDGEQDMTRFGSVLPPGVVGNLNGVAKCSDADIAVARAKTGREELAGQSCPAASQIGTALVGAGVGPSLTYVPGKIFLGGPYKGDPLSVVSVTPAVAGPFDAGDVVVQIALDLNPKTAEVEVDGASSDPIPHILQGIPLKVRDVRVHIDREHFILNPTSCDESSARATLFGSYRDVFDPADDVPVDLSTRYQAANCLNLGFKPHLGLHLRGGTRRGAYPGLKAVYSPRSGEANVKGLVVRLPRSAFLEQGHIRTICTRVQFAAKSCPAAARYGYIKAWTPLLDEPLQGPVWLRSSNHKLPDLVFDLHGLVDVEVATRIDSVKGGIRATVEDAPDAPLARVILHMQGGKKGLIVNSRNLCARRSRAAVRGVGQNGRSFVRRPLLQIKCRRARMHSDHHRRRLQR